MLEWRAWRGARSKTGFETPARGGDRRSRGRGAPIRAAVVLVLALGAYSALTAAEQSGQVTATGVPIPGATVTASQGDKKVVVSTGPQGTYALPDLTDGVWTIRVEMPGFAPLTREVTVGADAEPVMWELTLLPFEEITRGVDVPAPRETVVDASQTNATKPSDSRASNTPLAATVMSRSPRSTVPISTLSRSTLSVA